VTTFKVGDKVTHEAHGDGEVKYGPFSSFYLSSGDCYLVEFAERGHATCSSPRLTPRPAFKVGDRATWGVFHEVTVTAGPFHTAFGTTWYVVVTDKGTEKAESDDLSLVAEPAPLKVGDKIRILADSVHGTSIKHGEMLKVARARPDSDGYFVAGGWFLPLSAEGTSWERVQEDTETINGVTYVMGARYKDRQGDFWEFSRQDDGGVTGKWCYSNGDPGESGWSLESAVENFSPLTRVED